MNKFLESYNILRLYQEEIGNINRPITSPENETVILKLQTNKISGPDSFTGKHYEMFREELTDPSETTHKNHRERSNLKLIL